MISDLDVAARRGTCSVCGPVDVKMRADQKRAMCRTVVRRLNREHNRARRARIGSDGTRYGRIQLYGMRETDYTALLHSQKGRCAACRKKAPKPGEGRSFAVDHCHATGTVRGILCHGCNRAIGFAGDDPAVLRALAVYVELGRQGGLFWHGATDPRRTA